MTERTTRDIGRQIGTPVSMTLCLAVTTNPVIKTTELQVPTRVQPAFTKFANGREVKEAQSTPIQQQWVERIVWQSFTYYPRLRKVERYLEEHLHQRLTVQDAAQVACCEYKYFSSYFQAKVNIHFTDWVRLVRVAEAARLLRTEDLTVYQTARQVGFRNARALERAFQRFCGRTPTEYKADFRPEQNG